MGERLVDRMEFEELALKGIDPSLGPQVQAGTQISMEPKSQRSQIKVGVNVIIPSSCTMFIHPPDPSDTSCINKFRLQDFGRASRARCVSNT